MNFTNLVSNYYFVFLAVALILLGLTITIRFKQATAKRDKLIYNIYSIVLGIFVILLILFKVGA